MSQQELKALIVEDDENDLLLTIAALRSSGLTPVWRHVLAEKELEAALLEQEWDAVICDHHLQGWDSKRALALVQRLQAELPFIVVSGATSDDVTANAIVAGAVDVVGKDQLVKLGPLLRRELRERRRRRDLASSHRDLERLAYFDPITGLANERRFLGEVRERCGERNLASFAVVLAGVRQFARLVRFLGQRNGDLLAMRLAETLRTLAPQRSVPAYLGEGRFALVKLVTEGEAAFAARLQRLHSALPVRVMVAGTEVSLNWDIGGALHPDHGDQPRQLLRRAELAMKRAAQSKSPQLFTAATSDGFEPDVLEAALRLALRRQEFFLDYQPQFDLITGARIGAEALLRWRHPRRGIVSPGEFIPILEETGLIVPVGEWVLRTACRQAASWRRAGGVGKVAVNIATLQFEQASLPAIVRTVLEETALPPGALELEITESIAMNDQEQVVRSLRALRELGVCLAIDDFGTGYCSLAYLKHFPVDRLKIDQTFIRGIDSDPRDRAIVRAAIAMAHALGLEVLAEGVESQAHVAFLRANGCPLGQGFYLGRPAPPELLSPLS